MANGIFSVEGGCTKVNYRVLGPILNNVYCIDDGAGGVIMVDPERSVERILEMAQGLPVSAIFVTHRHHDHIGALRALHDATGAAVYAGAIDSPDIKNPRMPPFGARPEGCSVDFKLNDNDTFQVGACTWRFLHTPGHTEGGGCFYLAPETSPVPKGAPLLISGDTLFCGTIGRTDFDGGSMKEMARSMKKLAQLSDETIVLPGHNEITSIGAERVRTIEFYSQL